MFLLGAISLSASVGYNSSTLAFIGLGLAFWGAVLLYVRPEEYAKKVLLEAVSSPSLAALYQVIRDLGYRGDRTYLPPKYFADPETTKVYISKHKRRRIPTPEQAQLYDNQPIAKTTLGILITPPGIQLSNLLEKSMGKSFTKTDLKNLQQNLPRLFIEKLEIAEDLELQEENDMASIRENRFASPTGTKRVRARRKSTVIYAKMTKPIYETVFKEAEEPSQITSSIGCPLCSAIAIAIAKSTGKPVRITGIKSFEDGNTLEASYKILEG
jgi:hypothetical protein